MQNYFDDQNYQFLKSKPLGNDFGKQKKKDQNEMFATENKNVCANEILQKQLK